MAGGRPTKYKPEYCQMLIDHMSQGLSFESFAGAIDTVEETIYDWARHKPEFSEAKKLAFSKNRNFWDKIATASALGKLKDANPTMVIFNLKNRFPKQWRDRHEMDVHATVETTQLGPERLVEELKMVLNKPNESGPPQYIPVSDRDVSSGAEGLLQEESVLDGPKVLRLQGHNT